MKKSIKLTAFFLVTILSVLSYSCSGDDDGQNVTTYVIGDFAQGGIVFWVDETAQHGLVCAKQDQSDGERWHAGTGSDDATNAFGDDIFTGETNTAIIIATYLTIGDGNTYAARISNELTITEGGIIYDDWYLPSKKELSLINQNKAIIETTAIQNGGTALSNDFYWSSTESTDSTAWSRFFGSDDSYQLEGQKKEMSHVRSIRSF